MAKYYDAVNKDINLTLAYWVYIIYVDGFPIYVGKAKGFRRVCQHYTQKGYRTYKAIQEAKAKGLVARSKIVFTSESEEDAFDEEIRIIANLRKINIPLINIMEGGTGKNRTFTDEHRKKLSDSLKGKKHSPERIEANRRGQMGLRKGVAFTEAHKEALKASWTPERRANSSKERKGMKYPPHSQERKDQMSRIRKGTVHSEETKKKMSEAHKGKVKTPEHLEKIRLKKVGTKASPELKKKLSEIHLERWRKIKQQQTKEQNNGTSN